MNETLTLKDRVRTIQEPLEKLVESLPEQIQPPSRFDASDRNFADQPWQGEWDNKFDDIGIEG